MQWELYTAIDNKPDSTNTNNEPSASKFSDDGDYKMVLVVRNDLQMGKGKIAAQCSHATLGAFKKAQKKDMKMLEEWEESGQAKIVLKAQSEEELFELDAAARKVGLISYIVMDAGKTQIASGTNTVLAIGPGSRKAIDQVTGKLKLM